MATAEDSRLLSLPLEIREQIYVHLLGHQHVHITESSSGAGLLVPRRTEARFTQPRDVCVSNEGVPSDGASSDSAPSEAASADSTASVFGESGAGGLGGGGELQPQPQPFGLARVRLHALPLGHPHPDDEKGRSTEGWRAVLHGAGAGGDEEGSGHSRSVLRGDCAWCAAAANETSKYDSTHSLLNHPSSTALSPTAILLICRQIYLELTSRHPLDPAPDPPSCSSPLPTVTSTSSPTPSATKSLLHRLLQTNIYSFSPTHFPFRYLAAMPTTWINSIQRVWLADVTQAESLLNHYRARVNLPGLRECLLGQRVGRLVRPRRPMGNAGGETSSGGAEGGGSDSAGGEGGAGAGGDGGPIGTMNGVNGMRVRMELSFRVANLERLARQFENRGVLLVVVEEGREGVPWRDFIAGLNVNL